MLLQEWTTSFSTSLQGLWMVSRCGSSPVLAIIIFIVGWAIGSLVDKALRMFSLPQSRQLFDSMGASDLAKSRRSEALCRGFIGTIVNWFIIILFLNRVTRHPQVDSDQ